MLNSRPGWLQHARRTAELLAAYTRVVSVQAEYAEHDDTLTPLPMAIAPASHLHHPPASPLSPAALRDPLMDKDSFDAMLDALDGTLEALCDHAFAEPLPCEQHGAVNSSAPAVCHLHITGNPEGDWCGFMLASVHRA